MTLPVVRVAAPEESCGLLWAAPFVTGCVAGVFVPEGCPALFGALLAPPGVPAVGLWDATPVFGTVATEGEAGGGVAMPEVELAAGAVTVPL